jgi:hypothetical protein
MNKTQELHLVLNFHANICFSMAPPKSTIEAWKHVDKLNGFNGRHLKFRLCNVEFVGSLTRPMDHLLSISNGRGGGVKSYKNVSAKLEETLQKNFDGIKKAKKVRIKTKDNAFKKRLQRTTTHFLQAWLQLEVYLSQ